MDDVRSSGADPDRMGRTMSLLGRVVPGVVRVHDQVAVYAAGWHRANAEALAGTGPLWVALGDSMSQGIGASSFEAGWIPRAAAALGLAGRPYRVVNLSVSGATTASVLRTQVPALETLGTAPDLVTVLVGGNDVLRRSTRQALPDTFGRLLDHLPDAALVAELPQPIRTARAVNRLIAERAESNGVVPVDVRPVARKVWKRRAPDLFHPNDRSYAELAELFTAAALRVTYPRA